MSNPIENLAVALRDQHIKFYKQGLEDGRLELQPATPANAIRNAALDIEAAAKKLAECMDYPWEHMPEQGRMAMCGHAVAIFRAAMQTQPSSAKGDAP